MEQEHQELKELVAAYALGALPEDELPVIRAHILSCEECMAEADGYASTTSDLALAVEPVLLPQGFADRVLEAIHEIQPAAAPAPARTRRWYIPQIAAGMAALMLAAFGIVNYVDTRARLTRHERAISALLQGRGGWELRGPGEAIGKVVSTEAGGTFAISGLDAAPEDRIYQLWLMRGDCGAAAEGPCEVFSAGTFDVSNGIAIVQTKQSPNEFDGAAITIEPAGGSEQPTTDPIASSA